MKIKFDLVKRLIALILFLCSYSTFSQALYFPPTNSSSWDTIQPSSLGWCSQKVDSLNQYIAQTGAKAFIILKNGKIVFENYYGTFTKDSIWYWASAGKSLVSMLVGKAEQEGILRLNDSVSRFLGNGWSSCPPNKEKLITVRNQLCMTSGLNDGVSDPDCVADTCLQYLTDAGTRWAYHNAPYLLTHNVLEQASGVSLQQYTNLRIKNPIGMQSGWWFNGTFFSKARDMARFGLLALANGTWNGSTVINNSTYINDMKNTSNPHNLSYGYLWWLNGKSSFMVPQTQLVFPGYLIPNAPADMYAALGKNDQKIYVVPSLNMVVVRMGNPASSTALALSTFDNVLWQKIMNLECLVAIQKAEEQIPLISCFPNPAQERLTITNTSNWVENENPVFVNEFGQHVKTEIIRSSEKEIEVSLKNIPKGFYILRLANHQIKVVVY